MAYFSSFPKISYPFLVNGQEKNILVTDITTNVRFIQQSLASIQLFDTYSIKDGETPEIISSKFYGTPNYHWIIMLANQRYDYINDFPRSQHQLDKYIDGKYGITADSIAYYLKAGKVVDAGTVDSIEISNRDHETIVNETKRQIKIIPQDYVKAIMNDLETLLNG